MRPVEQRELGRTLNLPFLKQAFSPEISLIRQDSPDVLLLRTGTSYLRYVRVASGQWLIYDYGDKPIE